MATPRLYNALRFHPLIVNPDMAEPEFWNQRGPGESDKCFIHDVNGSFVSLTFWCKVGMLILIF